MSEHEFTTGFSFVEHEAYLSDLLDQLSEEYREWAAGDGHPSAVRVLLTEIAATARCARRRFDADEQAVGQMAAEVEALTSAAFGDQPETGDPR